jgi:transcriptional regulator with XRE-family HTH domain
MAYMSMSRLAAYLKKRRAAAKLTLREVAQRAGVDHGFVARVEAGAYKNLGIDTIRKLAEGYEVPFETLLLETGYVEGEAPKPEVPALRTYLRTHVGLSDEGAKEVEGFIDYAKAKYGKRGRS